MKSTMNPTVAALRRTIAVTALLTLSGCAELLVSRVDTSDVTRVDATSQGTLVATTRSGLARPALETAGAPEGIVRSGGRLYYVKDRGTTLLRGRQRVTNGLHLEKNGDVILADGRRVRLRDGWMVTTGGEVIEAPNYLR
jgi:hypothetical protein